MNCLSHIQTGEALKRVCIPIILVGFAMAYAGGGFAAQTLVASKIETGPVMDGNAADAVWESAQRVVTRDAIAGIEVAVQAVYTDEKIFLLVDFPDPDESRTHKSWVWDKTTALYRVGNDREDVFIVKWGMDTHPVDLSIYADDASTADVWFWKACRTDPAGYVDDKHHVLSPNPLEDAKPVTAKTARRMHLGRYPDDGRAPFGSRLVVEYEGDTVDRFVYRKPTGSRSDVKGKGSWKDGRWTIEFERDLQTGHHDDVQFDREKSFRFGISRYEIAGNEIDPQLSQPLYGCGDVGEILTLVFKRK